MAASEPVVTRESQEWERARERAKRRDQYRCRHCGLTEADVSGLDLQVHHILPISQGGTHSLDNLATLCNGCHQKIHKRHDGDGEAPLALLEEDRATLNTPWWRRQRWDLNNTDGDIIRHLRENGPTQLKDIADGIDASRQYVLQRLNHLGTVGYVGKLRRGVYCYISELEYCEVEKQRQRGDDILEFHPWDKGEQVELNEFVEDPREGGDGSV